MNINENEMKKISQDYHNLNDKLSLLEDQYKEEMLKLDELKKEFAFAKDFLNIETAKTQTMRKQLRNFSERYINNKMFKRNVKSFLLGLSIPLFALFIPDVYAFCLSDVFLYSMITGLSGTIASGVDLTVFSDRNYCRFSWELYDNDKYQEIHKEFEELEEACREKLCEYDDVTSKLEMQKKKTDELMKEIINTKNKILIIKEKLFNRIFDLPNEQLVIDETIIEESPYQLILR